MKRSPDNQQHTDERKRNHMRKRIAPSTFHGRASDEKPQQEKHEQKQRVLSEDLFFEVLTRVGKIKDVHQYKCVSRAWRSIIQSPPFFDAFRSHHRGGLVVTVAKPLRLSSLVKVCFLYSTLLTPVQEPEPFFCRSNLLVSYHFMGFTDVVNGLACVYEGGVLSRVTVCNICTGQTMRLPSTDFDGDSVCYLGYDPRTGQYKLLKFRSKVISAPHNRKRTRSFSYRFEDCEILTIGSDSSWRKLAVDISPIESVGIYAQTQSLVVNGFLYWMIDCYQSHPILVSFDLNKEEFGLILPPQDPFVFGWNLVQLMGRLALFCHVGRTGRDPEAIGFYTLDEKGSDSWSRHDVSLPPGSGLEGLATSLSVIPVGNLPTGQILLAIFDRFNNLSNCGIRYVIAYDHQKNKFEKFIVGELFHLMNTDASMRPFTVTCIQENITPLEDLFGKN